MQNFSFKTAGPKSLCRSYIPIFISIISHFDENVKKMLGNILKPILKYELWALNPREFNYGFPKFPIPINCFPEEQNQAYLLYSKTHYQIFDIFNLLFAVLLNY